MPNDFQSDFCEIKTLNPNGHTRNQVDQIDNNLNFADRTIRCGQVPDLNWQSPESGEVWDKERDSTKKFCSHSEGWWWFGGGRFEMRWKDIISHRTIRCTFDSNVVWRYRKGGIHSFWHGASFPEAQNSRLG